MPTLSTRFPDIREHILHKVRISRNGLSANQIYLRQKLSRDARKAQISLDVQRQEFFLWIDTIQKKLGLSDYEFAQALYLSAQTLKLWKRRTGHYPSQQSFKRLLQLERQARLVIKDLQTTIRIRS